MKEILYRSTRSTEGTLKASEAILKGLADDGGLFVPVEIPKLEASVEELSKMSYQEVAYEVMKLFFTDFTEEELRIVSQKHMILSLIQKKLHHLQKLRVLTILSYSTVLQSHSRIWHYQFFHICLQHQQRRIM